VKIQLPPLQRMQKLLGIRKQPSPDIELDFLASRM
jgi:hypothetical protein